MGDIFLTHFGPLSTNWALFKLHSLPEYCYWPILIPLLLQCTHLLMATSSRIMHHVTKLKSSQTGFLNMTMCSLYSNGLQSPDLNPMVHLWYALEREIRIMDVHPTNLWHWQKCQYEPKSLRNVSNTLLNLYREELRQFWRQKGIQPRTSKVYLIKWLVSVYLYSIPIIWKKMPCKYFNIGFLFMEPLHTHHICALLENHHMILYFDVVFHDA